MTRNRLFISDSTKTIRLLNFYAFQLSLHRNLELVKYTSRIQAESCRTSQFNAIIAVSWIIITEPVHVYLGQKHQRFRHGCELCFCRYYLTPALYSLCRLSLLYCFIDYVTSLERLRLMFTADW